MEKDLKVQNEIKIKTAHLNIDEVEFRDFQVVVKSFFGEDIDFNPNKDWTVSLAIKNSPKGMRGFTGTLKMTDANVTGEQMQIFSIYEKQLLQQVK